LTAVPCLLGLAPSITAALRANGIMGNIHIRAYGDFNSSEVDKEALNSTNISLHGSITDSSSVKHTGEFSLPFIFFIIRTD